MNLIDNNGVSKTNEEGISTIELGIPVKDEYWHCLMILQGSKWKERVEAVCGLANIMMQDTQLNKKSYDSTTTKQEIPIEYAHALRGIGRLLGHLLNSTSWKDGVLYDFDKQELLKRVAQIHFNR